MDVVVLRLKDESYLIGAFSTAAKALAVFPEVEEPVRGMILTEFAADPHAGVSFMTGYTNYIIEKLTIDEIGPG
jgi:hypothetical protein